MKTLLCLVEVRVGDLFSEVEVEQAQSTEGETTEID